MPSINKSSVFDGKDFQTWKTYVLLELESDDLADLVLKVKSKRDDKKADVKARFFILRHSSINIARKLTTCESAFSSLITHCT